MVLCAWVWQKWTGWEASKRTYHFKGTLGGHDLWEYSAKGDEVAIWSDWVTNWPDVHLVVRTGTVHQLMMEKK
jgi:hypothetical protein